MTLRLMLAALLAASIALPADAAPVVPYQLPVMEAYGGVVMVASKRKKKKQQVRRNPRNGDVLLGRVGSSSQRRGSRARRDQNNDAALGALLGAALVGAMVGGASSGRSGGMPSRRSSHGRSGGGNGGGNVPIGKNCGVQYWTDQPTSPTC